VKYNIAACFDTAVQHEEVSQVYR